MNNNSNMRMDIIEQVDSPKETHWNDSIFLAAVATIAFNTSIIFEAFMISISWLAARKDWFVTIIGFDYLINTSEHASYGRVPSILYDQAFAKAVIARQSGVAFNLDSGSMTIVCVENQHH